MAEHLALPGLRQNDELVAEVAADRPRIGRHRDRPEPHARERTQIGHEHLVVGLPCCLRRQIEGIGILHEELASSHHAETRAHLITELPLDMEEVARQFAIRPHAVTENLRNQLLVGGPVEHLALVAILEAQHLRTIGVVAPALAPQLRLLQRRHQHLDGAGPLLLLAHDLLDLLEHAKAKRQPGVDASAGLADHAGPQHQLVGDDLRLARRLAQDGKKIA